MMELSIKDNFPLGGRNMVLKTITILSQLALIHVFYFAGVGLAHILSLPVPGSIVGLVLLLLSLFAGIVKLEWIEKAGGWLLAELLLFFVPSAVGILNYKEILNWQGLETVLLILISTFIVMAATGFTAEKLYRRKRKGGHTS